MSAEASIDILSLRVAHLERQVAFLMAHLELDPPEPGHGASLEVMDLMRRGKKIQAIKQYREETGVGLKEAKKFVESLDL